MKVSIITVCFNSDKTIYRTLESVANQSYGLIEHIVIDGNSKDQTKDIVKNFEHVELLLSEPDNGIYDAMNKGIKLATGDIVGILNSDDFFTRDTVVEEIVKEFDTYSLDALYADVQFVSERNLDKVVRYYSSADWNVNKLKYGFMPAHPSFYVRRKFFDSLGFYNTSYSISADFDLLVRFLKKSDLKYKYIKSPLVTMLSGGVSTSGLKSKYILSREILRSCRDHGIKSNWLYMVYRIGLKSMNLVVSKFKN